MAKAATYDDVIKTMAENYKEIEHSIANQLLINVPNHYPTVGAYRETVWKSLFDMVVPKKYCIEQGVFIIDAYGHKSKEVDLVFFDELYTPYIFNYGKIKFIPIEAVSAVVQCKSKSLKKDEIVEWANSIDKLTTSLDSVARMVNLLVDNMDAPSDKNKVTQTATRPLKILCYIQEENSSDLYKDSFDIILSVDSQYKKLYKSISGEQRSLKKWNDSLNHAYEKIEDIDDRNRRERKRVDSSPANREELLKDLKVLQSDNDQDENVILSLIFQLNQLLMVINNPMLFPHRAYAQRFSDILQKSNQSKGEDENGKQGK